MRWFLRLNARNPESGDKKPKAGSVTVGRNGGEKSCGRSLEEWGVQLLQLRQRGQHSLYLVPRLVRDPVVLQRENCELPRHRGQALAQPNRLLVTALQAIQADGQTVVRAAAGVPGLAPQAVLVPVMFVQLRAQSK